MMAGPSTSGPRFVFWEARCTSAGRQEGGGQGARRPRLLGQRRQARQDGDRSDDLAGLLDLYLEHLVRIERSPKTVGTYRYYVAALGRDEISRRTVRTVAALDLDRYYVRLAAAGKSPAVVDKVHMLLSGALLQAVKWEMVCPPCGGRAWTSTRRCSPSPGRSSTHPATSPRARPRPTGCGSWPSPRPPWPSCAPSGAWRTSWPPRVPPASGPDSYVFLLDSIDGSQFIRPNKLSKVFADVVDEHGMKGVVPSHPPRAAPLRRNAAGSVRVGGRPNDRRPPRPRRLQRHLEDLCGLVRGCRQGCDPSPWSGADRRLNAFRAPEVGDGHRQAAADRPATWCFVGPFAHSPGGRDGRSQCDEVQPSKHGSSVRRDLGITNTARQAVIAEPRIGA